VQRDLIMNKKSYRLVIHPIFTFTIILFCSENKNFNAGYLSEIEN